MFKARKNVDTKGKKRDIIEEYANFGSTVYAPITRDGLSLDKKANKYEVQPEALSTYQGLCELEQTLPDRILRTRLDVTKIKKKFDKTMTRKEVAHKIALLKAQGTIDIYNAPKEEEEGKKGDDKLDLRNILVRPNTPNFQIEKEETEEDDEKRKATLLLQRLIRGRAVQNMMFEGKEKRLDLIAELRATEEWKQAAELEEEKILI
jgi:hypothetical protein